MNGLQFLVFFVGFCRCLGSQPQRDREWLSPEGPGEGCYSVCLSKEIKKLHSGIEQVNQKETNRRCENENREKMEATIGTNAGKIQEIIESVQVLRIGSTPEDIEKIANLEKKLNESLSINGALSQENSELGEEITNATKLMVDLDEAIKNKTFELENATTVCEMIVTASNETLKCLTQNLKESITEKEQLETVNEESLENVDKISKENEDLKSRFQKRATEKESLQQEIEEMKNTLSETNEQIALEREDNKELKKNNEKLEKEKREKKEKFVEGEKENEKLGNDKYRLRNEVSDREEKLKSTKERVNDVEAAKAVLEETNEKLKQHLEEAETKKESSKESALRIEREKLQKELDEAKLACDDAEHKIASLEDDVRVLQEDTQEEKLDYSGSTYGATSFAPFCEPKKAFGGDKYSSWTSLGQVPQRIWIQLAKIPRRVTRYSFRSSIAPENGASKYQFVGSTDENCGRDSQWEVLDEDLSGEPFRDMEETKSGKVSPTKYYRCYGINVLDVAAEKAKWAIMSQIEIWGYN